MVNVYDYINNLDRLSHIENYYTENMKILNEQLLMFNEDKLNFHE